MTPFERAMRDVEGERYPPAAEWFFAELALLRERWDIFGHPLYARWSSGGLGPAGLRDYAEEHDHLVLALATVAQRAAEKANGLLGDVLDDHVAVVEERVSQWREFAAETGWGPGSAWHYATDAYPETLDCVEAWLGDPA